MTSYIRHTIIVTIFYSFVSFNILTQYSFRIKIGKVVFMYDTEILDGIDSPKIPPPPKKNNSCGKTKIDNYFRSKYKNESELCIQNLS